MLGRRVVRSGSVVAIALLAGLTAFLAFTALRGPRVPGGSGVTPTGSVLTNPPSVHQSAQASGDLRAPAVEPPLSMVDTATVYLGTVGTCLGGSTMERTTDGGATWQQVPSPVSELVSIDAKTSVVAEVVGPSAAAPSGQGCKSYSWSTSTAGRKWDGPSATTGLWYRLPDRTEQIQTPAGIVSNPCKVPSLPVREIDSVDRTTGALLCPTGEVMTSEDGGATWRTRATVRGAVALAWETPADGSILTVGSTRCPGLRSFSTTDGGEHWQAGGCVGNAADAGPKARAPSLDFLDSQNGVASVAGGVYRTTDGGRNWQRLSG